MHAHVYFHVTGYRHESETREHLKKRNPVCQRDWMEISNRRSVYRYIHISVFKNHDTQRWYAACERYAVSAQVIRLKLLVLDLQTNSPASATAHFKVMTVCVSGFGHKEIKIANKRVWPTQRVRI